MVYICNCCGYETEFKHNADKHLDRKTPCGDGEIIMEKIDVKLNCEHCNAIFTSNRSIKRHQDKSCKILSQQKENDKDVKIRQLEAQLAEAKAESKANVVNNYIQINLNGYNQTSFDHLTNAHFKRSIGKMIYSIPQMIQDVHFNKKAPENHNIYINNIRNKYAMVYDGKQWTAKDQELTITELINNQEYAIEEWLGEGDNFPKEMKKFNEYLAKVDSDKLVDGKTARDVIREEVKMLLYNNRNIVKNKN